jgi:hypothetical protein
LDYLDTNLKSLWYTYSEQKGGIRKWLSFLAWTRDNIQNGQNAIATLYEQLNTAKQLPDKSPVQFNAYLSAIERDLPHQDEKASALLFYSKLTQELRRQFKTSDVLIPETRASCVAVAQRIWEGLYDSEAKQKRDTSGTTPKYPQDSKHTRDDSKYPRIDSKRNRQDQYHLGHRRQDDRNKDRFRDKSEKEQPTCFRCHKPGHYATSCPDVKEAKTAKIQSAQEQPVASQPSSRSGSEQPQTLSDSEDSSDSLN